MRCIRRSHFLLKRLRFLFRSLASGMAFYNFDGLKLQVKVIDFSSMQDVVAGSTMAFLGKSSLNRVSQSGKLCHAYSYVALAAGRFEDADHLCGVCGWLTGRKHDKLICGIEPVDECRNCFYSESLCVCCLLAVGMDVRCLHCVFDANGTGIEPARLLMLRAWYWSGHFADALLNCGPWHFSQREANPSGPWRDGEGTPWPFQVTRVIQYEDAPFSIQHDSWRGG